MQSMNQSLLALLVHNIITYDEAMRATPDPEDLSLKLRKMFPVIEERGGDMSPSNSDFSQILELQQFKKLYEEQEEKFQIRISDKDATISNLQQLLTEKEQHIEQMNSQLAEIDGQSENIRSQHSRLRQEAQEKIDKLTDRIRELNQKLIQTKGSA
jgi:peptidoglycan hydrolase CwlO-like protein